MFKTLPGDGASGNILPAAKEKNIDIAQEKKAVFCGFCHHAVSDPDEEIRMNGVHIHLFANPHGLVFEIGCYKRAKGCYAAMEPTSEFTWFSGYQWQIALCRSCHRHLGWFFSSDTNAFYGLILDNVIIG